METIVTNTNTSSIIQNQDIIRKTDNGITTNRYNCWNFIPKRYINEEHISSEYYREEPAAILRKYKNTNPNLTYSETVSNHYTEKLERRFGFKDLVISTRQISPNSAIISEEIDVSRADHISIDCTGINMEYGSIELSILDNTDEIPVLPNQSLFVHKEKLWYDKETRFLQDLTQPVVLYEDNKPISRDYASLSIDDFQSHTYALSYTAAQDYCSYKPVSNAIMVKAIIRQYESPPFIGIQNLIVHKYGETIEWNLKQ